MATRKREKKLGHIRTVIDEPLVPEEEGDDPFKFALREFGDEEALTLHVYRYDPMTGKPRYAKSVPFQKEIHGLEWLQRMFGAGEYLLRFYDSEGNSKNRSVSIDDDPQRRKEPEPSSSHRNDELVSVLREQNMIFLKALLDRGGAHAGPATESPVTLKILDALLPQALSKPDTSGALLSMLEKGITIAMEAKSEGEGGTAGLIRTLVKELGPTIQDFARARMMAPPMPMRPIVTPPPQFPTPPAIPAQATPPPQASPPPQPSSPAAPASPEDAARAMIEGTVTLGAGLVEQAWRGKEPPEDVADWILGEVPPNYYEHLLGLTVEKLTALDGRYGQIDRAWLDQVLASVRAGAEGGETGHAETG